MIVNHKSKMIMLVKKNILETIGYTLMVRINRFGQNPNVNIFAKLGEFTGNITRTRLSRFGNRWRG